MVIAAKKKVKKKVKKKAKKSTTKKVAPDKSSVLKSKMAKLRKDIYRDEETLRLKSIACQKIEQELRDIKDDAIKKNGKILFMTDDDFHCNDYGNASDNIEYLIEDLKQDGFCEDIVKVNVKVIPMTKEEYKKFEHYQSEYDED